MAILSRKFAAPWTDDLEQWEKVEFLVAHGFLFQSVYEASESGGRRKVAYPNSLAEANRRCARRGLSATRWVED